MRTSAVAGIIFANSHDENLEPLTLVRAMSSVPFGGRFRLVDFALSSFVNAGITNVGIIVKSNYRSLMNHIGSGVSWDLDRKNGGVRILPPFNAKGLRRYEGYIEALMGATDFLESSDFEHVVLYDGCVVGNFDFSKAIEYHNEKGADVTLLYKQIEDYRNDIGAMTFSFDETGRVIEADFPQVTKGPAATSFGVMVIKKDVLLPLLKSAYEMGEMNIERDVIAENLEKLKVYAFCHNGFAAVMDSPDAYCKANMALLNEKVRKDLFTADRPIFTKIRDDMPTRYGLKSDISNSFLADGCVIEGTVKNSILFRGVKVGKGAKVENCILMQGTEIGDNSDISYVVSDKNANLGKDIRINGKEDKYIFIEKNKTL